MPPKYLKETLAAPIDKHATFVRVGERHVTAALRAIKRIANLAQPRYGCVTPEEVELIVDALDEEISRMAAAFKPGDRPKFKFLSEEDSSQ